MSESCDHEREASPDRRSGKLVIELVRSERFEEFLAARAGRLAQLATEAASDPQL
jgi:hypothetical protein